MTYCMNAAKMRHELRMARLFKPNEAFGLLWDDEIGESVMVLPNDPRLDKQLADMEEYENHRAREMAEIGAMAHAARERLHNAPFDAMQKLIWIAAFIAVVQLVF